MSLAALGMLTVAAVMHATWNFVLKRAADRYLVLWWAMVVSSFPLLPLLPATRSLPPSVWPYVAASAACEAGYFIVLAAAYGSGDFSVVYPIARGAAPALLTVWAALFLRQYPSAAGGLGIGLLVLGLIVVGSSARRSSQRTAAGAGSVGLALAVALLISLYSVIDGAAVRIVEPAPYVVVIFALTALLMLPVIGVRYGWSRPLTVWRTEGWRIVTVGSLTLGSYLLVVAAYSFAPVSYAGAVREMSVVFASIAGWRWLGEGFGAVRLAGSLLIFGGIMVIALAG